MGIYYFAKYNKMSTISADGQINNGEEKLLRCWQCKSQNGEDCTSDAVTSRCHTEATHCKSTVTYVISGDRNGNVTGKLGSCLL